MKLWFVDDRPRNHETWVCSFSEEIRASCELRNFLTIDELFAEFSKGILPDLLFVDFFVGERLGIEVIKWFADRKVRPVLIAHSSMEQANTGMVAVGADFHLEKIKEVPFTASIRDAFKSLEDVVYVLENRRVRQCP
jgi:CheY-like chemotaxis protein